MKKASAPHIILCVVYQINKVKWGKNLYNFLEEFGGIFWSSLFSQDKLFQFKKRWN